MKKVLAVVFTVIFLCSIGISSLEGGCCYVIIVDQETGDKVTGVLENFYPYLPGHECSGDCLYPGG